MDDREIILRFINFLISRITTNIRRKSAGSTGRTASLLRAEATSQVGTLFGPDYIEALESGRGPTRQGNTGGPTLRKRIEKWIEVARIRPSDDITPQQLAFLITRKIHEQGTRLFIDRRMSGILTETITPQVINDFAANLGERNLTNITTQLSKAFNDLVR